MAIWIRISVLNFGFVFDYLRSIVSPAALTQAIIDCLSVVLLPIREFFTHLETPPLPVKDFKFGLYSALMAMSSEGS